MSSVQIRSIFATFLLVAGIASAAEPAVEVTGPPAQSPVVLLATPDDAGRALESAVEPSGVRREREALLRIEHSYAAKVNRLQELARQTKGIELADLHRRIELLKAEQATEELQVRLEVARQATDVRRSAGLERVLAGRDAPPRAPEEAPESRPDADEKGTGGAR